MLLTPLRATAALLALVAGTALLPGMQTAAQAEKPCFDDCGDSCGHGCKKHHHHSHHHRGNHCIGPNCKGAPIDSRDLFYNYYVGPADSPNPYGANSVAAMYPSPVPVPPLVGHTYITYQPLLPHEFLYPHHHKYCSQYPGGGQVTTRVHYRTSILGHWDPAFGNRAPRPRGVEYLEDPLRR